jgi:hypothetical protein
MNRHGIHNSPLIHSRCLHHMPNRRIVDTKLIARTRVEPDKSHCSSRNQLWEIGSHADKEKRHEHHHSSVQHELLSPRQHIRRESNLILVIHELNLSQQRGEDGLLPAHRRAGCGRHRRATRERQRENDVRKSRGRTIGMALGATGVVI